MGDNAFESFRKKLQDRARADGVPSSPSPSEPAPPAAAEPAPSAAAGAESALERIRAARARLGKPETPAEAAPTPKPVDPLEAARARLGQLGKVGGASAGLARSPTPKPPVPAPKPATPPARPSGPLPSAGPARPTSPLSGAKPQAGGKSPPPAKPPVRGAGASGHAPVSSRARPDGAGDDFESYRRQKEQKAHENAKERAFRDGVEVQELDRSRIAEDRAERLTVEELGVERSEVIVRFGDAPPEGYVDPMVAEIDGDRPEAYDRGRYERLTAEELEAEGGVERPEGYDRGRSERLTVEELEGEIEKPEGFTSHRYQREKGKADGKKVTGFKRFEF